MNIVIFDTETTNLEKPFCYNIGYVIYDTETEQKLVEKDFVIEQVWHNEMLFNSAYYANKRPIYVNRMRARKAKLTKFGYACREMIRDFEMYNVSSAYAYNSNFDEKVFAFNCDWYKCSNPFDTIPVFDIRGYVHQFIAFTNDFKAFCDKHELYTDSGNYSTTAETLFRFLTDNVNFEEEHTALADSKIECDILCYCVECGAEWENNYKVYRTIPKNDIKEMTVFVNKTEEHTFKYNKKMTRNGNIYLTLN